MSGGGSHRQRQGKSRRDEFLAAARRLLFANGYRGTTMQQIATEAGYSKRAVYLDYLNKDELFISVCTEGLALLLQKLREVPWDRLPVESCIDRFLEVYIAFSHDHSEYFRMIFSEATAAIIANCSEAIRSRVAELERGCLGEPVGLMERAIREGFIPAIDPWEAAGIVVGSATGIILLSMGGSQTVFSRETLESLVTRAIRTLWRGLRSTEVPIREKKQRREDVRGRSDLGRGPRAHP